MNHLGGQQTSTLTSYASPGNIAYISLSAGSWIIIGNLFFPGTTYAQLSITTTSNTLDNNSAVQTANGYLNITRGVVIASGNPTYFLYANSNTAVTTAYASLYAVRVG